MPCSRSRPESLTTRAIVGDVHDGIEGSSRVRLQLRQGLQASKHRHGDQLASYVAGLDEGSPHRGLRLGFDTAGRLIELVVLRLYSCTQLLVHVMKAWPQYIDLIM
jgi:hypothetical protein